jgi:hypothetical protein
MPYCKLALRAAGGSLRALVCGAGTGVRYVPADVLMERGRAFTSLAAASLAENFSGAFYTAAANDPEGGALTYSIAGGADAAAFVMSGNQLSFIASPNYDLPGNADGNNVYLVQLRAVTARLRVRWIYRSR